MATEMKIPVSFRRTEKEIYDYAKGKRCPSAYIKDLIEDDMRREKMEGNSYSDKVVKNK
ncbi:hypothetical protein OD350_28910 (plasmid) [Clostridium beijerinckii]|uniref:hypothetical protein n=1 Tax=Clostridium beijerinckii TaxID=1520 RepID=UPI002227BDC5|nr:hypothetical protein [Clostridium beijerinckii]UYZ39096.1 hypothetical protein OD350_28910 [Clostridium beijerinckii]